MLTLDKIYHAAFVLKNVARTAMRLTVAGIVFFKKSTENGRKR